MPVNNLPYNNLLGMIVLVTSGGKTAFEVKKPRAKSFRAGHSHSLLHI